MLKLLMRLSLVACLTLFAAGCGPSISLSYGNVFKDQNNITYRPLLVSGQGFKASDNVTINVSHLGSNPDVNFGSNPTAADGTFKASCNLPMQGTWPPGLPDISVTAKDGANNTATRTTDARPFFYPLVP